MQHRSGPEPDPETIELAAEPVPSFWRRLGLHGPAIVGRWILRSGKRIAVFVVGMALVLGGVAMLVLPGPGLLVIIAGLAVLATEFAWAERMLDVAKRKASQAADQAKKANPWRRKPTRT